MKLSPLATRHPPLAGLIAILFLFTLAQPANSQVFSSLPRISPEVEIDLLRDEPRKHLDRVRDFLVDRQYDEAVDTLLRIMETHGQSLVPLAGPMPPKPAGPPAPGEPEEPRRPRDPGASPAVSHLPLRDYGQMVLASWAASFPEALALYRRRVDPRAEQFLKDAREKRDPALLRRIVTEMLASSFGDDALLALGDWELARGHAQAARAAWERISPLLRTSATVAAQRKIAPGVPLAWALRKVDWKKEGPQVARDAAAPGMPNNWVAYPDTDLDLAGVRARLVLASIFEGNLPRARVELPLFKELHPTAKGTFAGRDGIWAERLTEMLAEAERWPAETAAPRVRTFATNEARNGVAPAPTEAGGGPLWSIALAPLRIVDQQDRIGHARERVAEDFDGLLSYHPLVVDGKLFLYTGDRVRVFDVATGKPAWTKDGSIHERRPGELPLERTEPQIGVPRFTLTATSFGSANRLFARAGSPATSAVNEAKVAGVRGYLLGFDLTKEGSLLPNFPIDVEDRAWAFEGTPLADEASLYVAMRHVDRQIHVAAFDLGTGRLRWRRQVCASQPLAEEGEKIVSHLLLTRHEDTLYVNTNAGSVAALDVADGTFRWVVTYPRIVGNPNQPWQLGRHWFRDLNPCVYHRGLVIAAPADGDRLLGIDAATGLVLWESPPGQGSDAVHLLGVAGDRLIASGDYLYWIDAFTGRFVGQFPENGHPGTGGGKPTPSGYGRGLLAGDTILWPTRQQIYVFRQTLGDDGLPAFARQPIELGLRGARGGNLLLAGDILIVAGTDHLWAFDPYGKRKKPAGNEPEER